MSLSYEAKTAAGADFKGPFSTRNERGRTAHFSYLSKGSINARTSSMKNNGIRNVKQIRCLRECAPVGNRTPYLLIRSLKIEKSNDGTDNFHDRGNVEAFADTYSMLLKSIMAVLNQSQ